MKLSSLYTRAYLFIGAFILLVFATVLYSYAIFPELKRMNIVRSQLKPLEMGLEGSQHPGMPDSRSQELKTAIEKIEKLMFNIDEAIDFLETLPQVAKDTGNTLVNIKPGSVEIYILGSKDEIKQLNKDLLKELLRLKVEKPYVVMPLQIIIRGKYSEVIGFFEQIERTRQLIEISGINIVTTAEDLTKIDAKLSLNLYVCE